MCTSKHLITSLVKATLKATYRLAAVLLHLLPVPDSHQGLLTPLMYVVGLGSVLSAASWYRNDCKCDDVGMTVVGQPSLNA